MSSPAFIITVDTEGDNLWSRPHEITTRNADYLPRFQALCERHRLRPTYLVNYEMATCDTFVRFGRDVLARGKGEIGMHLHAWNSPPLVPLTDDDFHYQPYLVEYPDHVMKEKIDTLTALLEDRFGVPMESHRAGRWGFDGRYAAMLRDAGYRVDCSVTPGVDWTPSPGAPQGRGGSNYTSFPDRPYFVDGPDIAQPAERGLLEVPVTIRTSPLYRAVQSVYRVPVVRSIANRLSRGLRWVCPAESALPDMLQAAHGARRAGAGHVEMALHSSELMPGGSPSFRSIAAVEQLYADLDVLFADLGQWCRGMTLTEYANDFAGAGRPS